MSLALAEAGANLVLVSRSKEGVAETEKMVQQRNAKTLAVECDVTDLDRFKSEVIEKTVDTFGRIDILVNNAGIIRRAPAHEHSDEYWDEVIDVNLSSLFKICREVGNKMIEQKQGKIINIASLLTYFGGMTVPSYAASKGAVAQVTKALANEWAQHNIQINAIGPGYFETDNTAPLRENKDRYEAISARIPTGRWGQPEDLQGAVVFLASEASNYVNGHVLMVDGGFSSR